MVDKRCEALAQNVVTLGREEATARRRKWRERAEEAAAKGTPYAFRLVRAADDSLPVQVPAGGADHTLSAEAEKWASLWQTSEALPDETFAKDLAAAGRVSPLDRLTAEEIREAAREFSTSTSCSDACPCRGFGLISDDGL